MDLSKFRYMVLVIALAAAAVLVVVLASQKRDLLARIEGLTTRIRHPYPGLYVPAVTLPSITGDTVLVGQAPPGHAQVLFVFSTSCEFCVASLPAWKRIARELDRNEKVEILGLSIDSGQATRQYVEDHGLQFPVTTLTDRRLQALYRAGITPQTLVMDGDGRVRYARIGAVTEAAAIDSVLVGARAAMSVFAENHPDPGGVGRSKITLQGG